MKFLVKGLSFARLIPLLIFVAIGYDNIAEVFGSERLDSSLKPVVVFTDSFETENNWEKFEEIVGESNCYGSGIGDVFRSTDLAYEGAYSLSVWANQVLSTKSNHVIAGKKYSSSGQGGIWRYEIHAFTAPETESSGQTGPEFSMQNTRQVTTNSFKTSTAGIQYIANSWSPEFSHWKVWIEKSPGIAGWHTFMTQTLEAGIWYTLTLEADYDNNLYTTFSLQGNGLDLSQDISAYRIAEEDKFNEEAFVITLESENLWNNCGETGAYEYLVYYDQVTLVHNTIQVFSPLIFKEQGLATSEIQYFLKGKT